MTDITFNEQISVITFGNIELNRECDFIAGIFRAAADKNVNIDMISRVPISTDSYALGFTFSDSDLQILLEILTQLNWKKIPMISCGNVKITVKSDEMAEKSGFASKVFEILSENSVCPILITTAVDEISVIVRQSESCTVISQLKNK